MRPGTAANAAAQKNVCELVHDSLSRGRRKVNPLPHALPDFPEPCSGTRAVNHAPQKAQPLGGVVAVSPDVVLRDLGIQGEKGIHASGPGEHVSRVAQLRGLHNDRLLNLENVFLPKQINPACPARKLAIAERIVVRTPVDLGDIKVTGKMYLGTHALQLRSLDRPMFQAQPDLIQSLRVLTKAVVSSTGSVQLLLQIGRHFDLQPARQCSLPGNEFPLPAAFAVFAALHECALDLDLGSQQMLPLIPGTVPEGMQGGWVKPQL